MRDASWIKVEATIFECFRAWEEPVRAAHPRFEIVADIRTAAGEVERFTSQQKLRGLTHHSRAPDPGDVVAARWDPMHRKLRLDLAGDARYDEKLIKARGRSRPPPSPPSPPASGRLVGSRANQSLITSATDYSRKPGSSRTMCPTPLLQSGWSSAAGAGPELRADARAGV